MNFCAVLLPFSCGCGDFSFATARHDPCFTYFPRTSFPLFFGFLCGFSFVFSSPPQLGLNYSQLALLSQELVIR